MIVCICQGVSDHTIERLVAAGARSVDALASRCGAGADCGLCCAMLESMVAASRPTARAAQEVPA
jgi:bacterioferritin-associated ferredoxin